MDEVIEPHKTSDLSDSQPTKGNIQGGLTTIEEKAFGNLEKIGKKNAAAKKWGTTKRNWRKK